jgi:peptidoglycan/LPS O-acetylase OafA/YrhL
MVFLITIVRTLQVGNEWPQYLHSLYQSLAKLIFVMGLSLTILPSLLGCKDSVINFVMDTRLFNFIAKISFCTYLIHLTILEIWVQSRTYSRYYTTIPTFVEFGGILVLSIIAGLIMTFLIELPFSKLQKQLINYVKKTLMKVKKEEEV